MTKRSTNPGTARPRGRDEVVAALLAATAGLCRERLPSSVSMRDVADRAQVTPGLVYHYFASKDDLLRATADAEAARLAAAAASQSDPVAMAEIVAHQLFTDPVFARIIAWMALDGRSVVAEMSGHPVLDLLATSVAQRYPSAGAADRIAGAMTVLLAIGLLAPVVNDAMQREPDDERLRDTLTDVLARLIRDDSGYASPAD